MKKLFTILSVFTLINSLIAQDLIVINDGDSINCKITKVKDHNIFFTFLNNGKTVNTIIADSLVKGHVFKFYNTKFAKNSDLRGQYQHFRIALNAGISSDLTRIDNSLATEFKDYYRDLKTGYHLGADLTYYFNRYFGAGLKYCIFRTSNEMGIYMENENGIRRYGNLSDDIAITFIGPTFSTRYLNPRNKNALITGISLGYLKYANDMVLMDKFKLDGSSLGMIIDFGYDIGFSENFSLGFQIALISGTLTQVDVTNGTTTQNIQLDSGEEESLYRFDFSIGLRFTM